MFADGDFFSRGETKIEETRAILPRPIETLDAHSSVERNRIEGPIEGDVLRSLPAMKTTIIFNFHNP